MTHDRSLQARLFSGFSARRRLDVNDSRGRQVIGEDHLDLALPGHRPARKPINHLSS